MAPAIGIDLGTTYSCVAVFQYGMVEIIDNDQGNRTTPSYVAFTERERLIGDGAKSQMANNPMNTIFDAKRLIGCNFDDQSVQEDIKHFPFTVFNKNGKPQIEAYFKGEKKEFCAEEISSMILTKMKETAEAYLGESVTEAVITVPAYFNDSQRTATKNAGQIAGLNVLRIINEPTAAAIAYGLDKKSEGERNILVFDLGGGTFDVSILTIDDGVFEVKATFGNTHLGGEDFDSRLVTFMAAEFLRKTNLDITGDKKALRRLRTECEHAKRTLSTKSQTSVDVAAFCEGVDFKSTISRAKFEEMCSDLFKSTLDPVIKALDHAGLQKSDIDEIILVGGSTRIPKIQRLLQEFFDGKELNSSINPDEAVAYGAAVQAAILSGDDCDLLQDLVLLDVAPLSLGIEIIGGIMVSLIKCNSTIPIEETKDFTTTCDNQTVVTFKVFEGERAMTAENNLLGRFDLKEIEPAPRGVPNFDVTFKIDADGILKVSAVDRATGNKNQIIIANDDNRLKQEEIDRMIRDAKQYKEHDDMERNRVAARNALDLYTDQLPNLINQASVRLRINASDRRIIEENVELTKKWLKDNQDATEQVFATRQRDLEGTCSPIIDNLYNM